MKNNTGMTVTLTSTSSEGFPLTVGMLDQVREFTFLTEDDISDEALADIFAASAAVLLTTYEVKPHAYN